MDSKEDKLEPRKEKLKNWLKDPYNLALIGILIFTFAIRFHYFLMTKSQPLWWDEAEYMSAAKGFAGIVENRYLLTFNRFPGFPLLASLFYMVGINNEVTLKFLLAFVPSILSIILMYFVLISMYSDKRIALISTAIFAVLWEHVFYSNRFHTENLSLTFGLLAILILFRVFLKGRDFYFVKNKYALLWIGLFSILCIVFRSGNLFFIPILILFLITLNLYKIPKKLRLHSAIGLILLITVSYLSLGFLAHKFPFISKFFQYGSPIYWDAFSVFSGFYQSLVPYLPPILFYAFILGITAVVGKIIIFPEGLKNLGKNIQNNSYKSDIFNLILLFGFLFFFVFILRPGGFEYRWFFIFLPGLFAFTAKGLINFGDYAQSIFKIKYLSIFLITVFLCLGVYTQFNHADMIIKNKLDSYSQVKDSGLWIKENANPNDITISESYFQHIYYTDKKVKSFPQNETEFNKMIEDSKPKYLILSIFQPLPEWAYNWPQRHNETTLPVQVYYADEEQNQVALVIYELKY